MKNITMKGSYQKFQKRNLLKENISRKSVYVTQKQQTQDQSEGEPKKKRTKMEVHTKKKEGNILNIENGTKSVEDQDFNIHENKVKEEDEDIKSEKSTEHEDVKDGQADDKISLLQTKKNQTIKNDVEEGCTIFLKNVPMDANDQDLRKACRKYGPLYYAIINREPISGHSKGTGFVKFKAKESADMCLRAGSELQIMDEILEVFPALSRKEIMEKMKTRDSFMKDGKKDSRNLYLIREGLIMAGSKAAEGVSASDMSKRHKLEQIKAQVLKNLNRFVSRNRLSIHNLPLNYDNEQLRDMLIKHTGLKPHECRVMRENKITAEHPNGKSKGFGFMSFSTHQNALMALRKLNNNPNIFGSQHRPIVAFSIEDRAIEKIKQKRQQKSKISNPTYQNKLKDRAQKKLLNPIGYKSATDADNKDKVEKHIKKTKQSQVVKTVVSKSKKAQHSEDLQNDFVGTPAKAGTQMRFRSFKKIQEQSEFHLKRVKEQKKRTKQKRIKEAHVNQKKNNVKSKKGKQKVLKDDLQPLVNKYKKLLERGRVGHNTFTQNTSNNQMDRVKWYKE